MVSNHIAKQFSLQMDEACISLLGKHKPFKLIKWMRFAAFVRRSLFQGIFSWCVNPKPFHTKLVLSHKGARFVW
jgi:hypothetical protein